MYKCKLCSIELENPRRFVKSKGICKKCNSKLFYHDNLEYCKQKSKQYYEANREEKLRKQRDRIKANPENRKAISRKSYLKHKEKRDRYNKEWVRKNRDKCSGYSKKWQRNNKEKVKKREKEYAKANSELRCFYSSNYRARKLKATPKWLSFKDKERIKDIYAKRKVMSERDQVTYHVDHIVPLKGDIVCGLHVPWNLQIITEKENCSKNNKLYLNNETSI